MQDNIRFVMTLPVQYFQQLVESCPDIIISVDKQGTITFYNDGARQNLGFSDEEVLTTNEADQRNLLDQVRAYIVRFFDETLKAAPATIAARRVAVVTIDVFSP